MPLTVCQALLCFINSLDPHNFMKRELFAPMLEMGQSCYGERLSNMLEDVQLIKVGLGF